MIFNTAITKTQTSISVSMFILVCIMFGLFFYNYISLTLKLSKIKRFKKQDVGIYENKKMLTINLIVFDILPFCLFILSSTFFGIILLNRSLAKVGFYGLEIFGLAFIILVTIFIFYWFKNMKQAMIIYKNNKLLILDLIISKENIESIKMNFKKTEIYINYFENNEKNQIILKNNTKLRIFLEERVN